MRSKYFGFLIGILFLVLGIMILKPVPIPDEKDCLVVKGKVAEIFEDGVHDVFFRLEGHDKSFYVNRGLERGLDLSNLREELMRKNVTIKYPRYWTPLGNSSKHISKIESDTRIVFTEID